MTKQVDRGKASQTRNQRALARARENFLVRMGWSESVVNRRTHFPDDPEKHKSEFKTIFEPKAGVSE